MDIPMTWKTWRDQAATWASLWRNKPWTVGISFHQEEVIYTRIYIYIIFYNYLYIYIHICMYIYIYSVGSA
jgi:hypothetical protein